MAGPSQRDSTREKILLAAIESIETAGTKAVTVREIARRAGANIALVSYYFQSKDLLVREALDRALENAFEDVEALVDDAASPPVAVARGIFAYLIEGLERYPGVTRAELARTISGQDSPLSSRFSGAFKRLAARVPAASPGRDGWTRAAFIRALMNAFSVLMFHALAPEFFAALGSPDLGKQSERTAFIDSLIPEMLKGAKK